MVFTHSSQESSNITEQKASLSEVGKAKSLLWDGALPDVSGHELCTGCLNLPD